MRNTHISHRRNWILPIPEGFSSAYELGNYSEGQIRNVMWKYLVRRQNIARAWTRINQHLPETLNSDESLEILEFSTAHGAMLEIWRSFGHRVVGTDFAWTTEDKKVQKRGVKKEWHTDALRDVSAKKHNNLIEKRIEGWPYQPIIESLDLDVRLFDAGSLPYPFEDNSFDVICCYQAIEAYAPPEHWLRVVHELCRVSRKTVLIGYNPLASEDEMEPEQWASARAALLELANYNHNGYQCIYNELDQTPQGARPFVCKIMRTGPA